MDEATGQESEASLWPTAARNAAPHPEGDKELNSASNHMSLEGDPSLS